MFDKKLRRSGISAPPPQKAGSKDLVSAPLTSANAALVAARVALVVREATTVPDPSLPMRPTADFVPNSWPNSGFRNSRQRGTRG